MQEAAQVQVPTTQDAMTRSVNLKEKVPAALTELRRMSIRKDAEMRGRREKMYFLIIINVN